MSPVRSHYDNLKVSRDAPIEVIDAAYAALAAKYDDTDPSSRAARVQQLIAAAHAVLSNPEHRREHDRWLVRMERRGTLDKLRGLLPIAKGRARATLVVFALIGLGAYIERTWI